uniref:Calpain catalytic domain-containing protein n=1 Tax=Periophthalmus magnuspinnatus TaxID=409849 RepID=A0A3B4AGU6_9GOBI
MFCSVKAFEGQQYSTLKRQCLQSGLLFEDPRFPAKDDSLFLHGNRIGRVVWKRPRVSLCPTHIRPALSNVCFKSESLYLCH